MSSYPHDLSAWDGDVNMKAHFSRGGENPASQCVSVAEIVQLATVESEQAAESAVSDAVAAQVPSAVSAEAESVIPGAVSSAIQTQLPSAIEDELDESVATLVSSEISAQVPAAVTSEVSAQVPTAVSTEVGSVVPGAVSSAIQTQLPSAIEDELDESVATLVSSEISAQVPAAVSTEVGSVVPGAVTTAINTQLPAAVSTELSTQVPDAVTSEVTSQVPGAVSTEVSAQVPSAVSSEIGSTLPAAVTAEIGAQLPAAVAAEIDEQMGGGGMPGIPIGGVLYSIGSPGSKYALADGSMVPAAGYPIYAGLPGAVVISDGVIVSEEDSSGEELFSWYGGFGSIHRIGGRVFLTADSGGFDPTPFPSKVDDGGLSGWSSEDGYGYHGVDITPFGAAVLELSDGSIMTFRSGFDSVYSSRTEDGLTWTSSAVVEAVETFNPSNSIASFQDSNGDIYLAIENYHSDETDRLWIYKSDDLGETWSEVARVGGFNREPKWIGRSLDGDLLVASRSAVARSSDELAWSIDEFWAFYLDGFALDDNGVLKVFCTDVDPVTSEGRVQVLIEYDLDTKTWSTQWLTDLGGEVLRNACYVSNFLFGIFVGPGGQTHSLRRSMDGGYTWEVVTREIESINSIVQPFDGGLVVIDGSRVIKYSVDELSEPHIVLPIAPAGIGVKPWVRLE